MSVLFLKLPAQAGASYQTVSYAERVSAIRDWSSLSEAISGADISPETPLVVVTPITQEVAFEVPATPKQRREAGVNLAALVEDQLADDFEQMHWLISEVDTATALLRGISRQYLRSVLAELAGHGLTPKCIVPEGALLPTLNDRWLWYPIGEHEVFIRFDAHEAALVATADARFVLESQMAKMDRASVSLHCPESARLPDLPVGVTRSSGTWAVWSDLLRAHSAVHWLRQAPQWLVGEFAVQEAARWSPAWRAALAVLSLSLVIIYGYALLATAQIEQRTAAVQQESSGIYQRLFPDERRLDNLAQRFARKLSGQSSRTGSQLLQALAETAPNPNWQIQQFDYRFDNQTRVELAGGALDELDGWTQRLTDMGLNVRIENSRQDKGVAMASLLFNAKAGVRP